MMGSSPIFRSFVLTLSIVVISDGQINRYINPAWLEMDANSEYYPGGEVISQILQAYGSSDIYGSSRYIDRNGYGRSHPRTRIVNNLNNAYYDSDSSTIDRNYDYIDNTVRGFNRYRNNLLDIPRNNRINIAATLPKTTYYQPEYLDRNLPSTPSPSYSRARLVTAPSDSTVSQELLLRGRETPRLIPRSTVTPDTTNENRKINS